MNIYKIEHQYEFNPTDYFIRPDLSYQDIVSILDYLIDYLVEHNIIDWNDDTRYFESPYVIQQLLICLVPSIHVPVSVYYYELINVYEVFNYFQETSCDTNKLKILLGVHYNNIDNIRSAYQLSLNRYIRLNLG